MAVPSGIYEVRVSVDTGTVFGRLEFSEEVEHRAPPPDLLERRLREVRDGAFEGRYNALCDLVWFDEEGERVVPALLACLEDEDRNIRFEAYRVLQRFPDRVAPLAERFLATVRGGEGVADEERIAAGWLVLVALPPGKRVEEALASLRRDFGEKHEDVRYILRNYARRLEEEQEAREDD